MCRALKVLCAAEGRERLAVLKRASVGAGWELVGGALSVEELARQVVEFGPDVVVIEAGLGPEAVACVRGARRTARLIGLGPLPGVDLEVQDVVQVRDAILALPSPGGPVTT